MSYLFPSLYFKHAEIENMTIQLTARAAKRVNRFLNRRGGGIGVRLGVRATGYSGLAYKLEYVDDTDGQGGIKDFVFESFGIKIFVDEKSLPFIDGTEFDFAREGLNEGFRFRNPNVKDECGCGESFRVR